ncbi:MAG TPA: hypothetical protein D7H96_00560, partial [Candidatus Poseidoniales archaeon]
AAVDWTVMESRTLPAESLSNGSHAMTWNLTVTLQGQLDIRLVIDSSDVIDEYDEGNNAIYFVVTGASISPGLVPSFAPSFSLLLIAGLLCGALAHRPRD